jgi:hypothetical protein
VQDQACSEIWNFSVLFCAGLTLLRNFHALSFLRYGLCG